MFDWQHIAEMVRFLQRQGPWLHGQERVASLFYCVYFQWTLIITKAVEFSTQDGWAQNVAKWWQLVPMHTIIPFQGWCVQKYHSFALSVHNTFLVHFSHRGNPNAWRAWTIFGFHCFSCGLHLLREDDASISPFLNCAWWEQYSFHSFLGNQIFIQNNMLCEFIGLVHWGTLATQILISSVNHALVILSRDAW